jgi:hypothetical protein
MRLHFVFRLSVLLPQRKKAWDSLVVVSTIPRTLWSLLGPQNLLVLCKECILKSEPVSLQVKKPLIVHDTSLLICAEPLFSLAKSATTAIIAGTFIRERFRHYGTLSLSTRTGRYGNCPSLPKLSTIPVPQEMMR